MVEQTHILITRCPTKTFGHDIVSFFDVVRNINGYEIFLVGSRDLSEVGAKIPNKMQAKTQKDTRDSHFPERKATLSRLAWFKLSYP